MTVTQLSNYLNQIVQSHSAQSFSYPSLKYYMMGSESEYHGGARQNNSNPDGVKGRQYPFLLASYPDADVAVIKQGKKIKYDIDLYFYDLQFYANNGATDNRSIVEIQRDLIFIARDVIGALSEIGNALPANERFQILQAVNDNYVRMEFSHNTAIERACSLKCSITVSTALPCSTFIFDPNALPAAVTPYPSAQNDYEKNK